MRPIAEKYFNDYKMEEVVKENGKGTKKVLKYYGDYYIHDMKDKKWKTQKILFFINVLLVIILYFFSITIKTESSYINYVSAPPLLFIIPLILLIMGSFKNIINKRKMSKNEYNESILFLKIGSIIGIISITLSIILKIIFITKHNNLLTNSSEITVLLLNLIILSLLITMIIYLYKIKFIKESSKC
ncbi:MAG: hypothetical protein ACPKM0_06335 [Pleomorphochaeta sp.]